MSLLLILLTSLWAALAYGQTLYKYSMSGCGGSLSVCSGSDWPQASCCNQGSDRGGSVSTTGILAQQGELTALYYGYNAATNRCYRQYRVYVGNGPACNSDGGIIGTGIWLSCLQRYSNPVYNSNCSSYKRKRNELIAAAANETEAADRNRENPDWLVVDDNGKVHPYYDNLKRPISKAEFDMQSQWEKENNRPYVMPDQTPVTPNHKRQEPEVTLYLGDECQGEDTGTVSGPNVCVTAIDSQSLEVDALPTNCNVNTYSDENCQDNALVAARGSGGLGAGCYSVSSFSSAQITCDT